VHTHPSGAARDAWYQVIGDHVYRTNAHPSGASATPSFRIDGANIFALDEDLDRLRDSPCFIIKDSMVYPADSHPLGASNAPWYHAREHGYSVMPSRTRRSTLCSLRPAELDERNP
jgi:hypothetical protein